MVDHHKQPDAANSAGVSSNNGSYLFQSRLDAFMVQEKAGMDQSNRGGSSGDLQLRLDCFLNDLQQKIDTGLPVTNGIEQPASYARLIFTVLIGACAAIIGILWFVQPVEQGLSPQLMTQQPRQDSPVPLREVKSVVASTPRPAVAHETVTPVAAITKAAPKRLVVKAVATVKLKVAARLGNIRNAPDRSSKILHRLLKGAVVTKLAERGEWFKVRLRHGTVAWAHRSIF